MQGGLYHKVFLLVDNGFTAYNKLLDALIIPLDGE